MKTTVLATIREESDGLVIQIDGHRGIHRMTWDEVSMDEMFNNYEDGCTDGYVVMCDVDGEIVFVHWPDAEHCRVTLDVQDPFDYINAQIELGDITEEYYREANF